MGRSPCCSKEGINRGAWTALEDKILTAYIQAHGEGKWRNLPKRAGLKRCGKSCRLRWMNYLRPDIKRGNISHDEEELIIRLHKLLGNRWSLIAGRLPGRTDNEIKNYWNTTLGKKCKSQQSSRVKKLANEPKTTEPSDSPQAQVIRTKATRCTKVLVPFLQPPSTETHIVNSTAIDTVELQDHQNYFTSHHQDSNNSRIQHGTEESHEVYNQELDFLNFGSNEFGASDAKVDSDYSNNLATGHNQSLPFDQSMLDDWTTTNCVDDNATMDLESLAFLLDPEEWP